VRADVGDLELVEPVGQDPPPRPAGEVPDAEQQQAPVGDHRHVAPPGREPLEMARLRHPGAAPDDDLLARLQTGESRRAQLSLGCLA